MLLSGKGSGALEAHLWNGRLVVMLCAATFVLFTVVWRRGTDNVSKSIVALGLLLAEILQFVLGYARETAWHIPLGATIFAVAAVLAFASIRQHIMPGTISGS
jgi:hypothetical protein